MARFSRVSAALGGLGLMLLTVMPAGARVQPMAGGGGSANVEVTPDGATTPERLAYTSGYTASFTVRNTGKSRGTYEIRCSGSSNVTCTGTSQTLVILNPGQSTGVDAYYDVGATGTGTLTLWAENTRDDDDLDSGYYNVPVVAPPAPQVDVTPYNYDSQDLARCAVSCFAATYAHGTVPYFSLDTPRNVTLVYHGDRVDPKPFIHVNVRHPPGETPTPDEFWLEAKKGGVLIQFLNGETRLKFTAASSDWQRLGGQFDASSYSTGVYDLDIIVTADYGAQGMNQTVVDSKLVIVNENNSPIARGWTLAGIQRLYAQGNGSALVTEGEGSAVYFAKSGGSFVTPSGEFSKLYVNGSGWKRVYPDSTEVYFNSAGRMTDVYDAFNNRTQIFYDGSNRVSTIRDPNSQDLILGYGSYGLSYVRDNVSPYRYTYLTVGSNRTLTQIKDPDNIATNLQYDGSLRLWKVTDRKGNTTTLAYKVISTKQTGKLESVTAPSIWVWEDGAKKSRAPVTVLDAWQTVGVPYNTSLAPIVRPDTVRGYVRVPGSDSDTAITKFTVDHWGQPVETINALGQTTTVAYDSSLGLATRIEYPTGGVDSLWYNSDGLITKSKPLGVTATNIAYNTTWVTQADSIWGTDRPKNRFWIGSNGRVDSTTVGGSNKTRYYYDSRGRVDYIKDANGTTIRDYTYSGTNGNLSQVTLPGSRTRNLGYDAYGRLTSDSVKGMPMRTFVYDSLNRRRKVYDGVNSNPTESVYDALYLVKVIDPKNQEYEFGYNAVGWTTWKEDPTGKRDSLFYSRNGDLTRTKNRRGQAIDFAYDALHRVVKKWESSVSTDTSFYTYSTGTGSNWVAARNSNATDTTYLTDAGLTDRVSIQLAGKTYTLYHNYTSAGWLDSLWATASSGGASFMGRRYVYNTTTGVLDELRLGGKSADLTFDSKLRPTSITYAGGDVTDLTPISWDPVAELESNQSHLDVLTRKLEYDEAGRIRSQFTAPIPAELGNFFGYDGLGRIEADTFAMVESDLCTWDDHDGWVCPAPTADSVHTYWYDAVDNLDSLVSSKGWRNTGSYATGNRITSYGGCTYQTDDDGNVEKRTCGSEVTDLWWSPEGLLDSLKVGGTRIRQWYDARGRLVKRQVADSTQYYLWNGAHLFAELDANGVDLVEYSYYPGLDRPHAVSAGDTVYFAHTDGFGNVIGLVSDTKVLRARYEYDRWGHTTTLYENLASDGVNRARFKGALWMGEEVELYYMRARWYEPHSGRFLSEDPIGLAGGINPYVYAGADAVNGRDPTGLELWRCRGSGYILLWIGWTGMILDESVVWENWECWPLGDGEEQSGGASRTGRLALQRASSEHPSCPAGSQWPVDSRVITSRFGDIRDCPVCTPSPHGGIDVAAELGDPIRPLAPGVVVGLNPNGRNNAGRVIAVRHPGGFVSQYMHLSGFGNYSVGDEVSPNDIIGYVGNSPWNDVSLMNYHLHLQLSRNGVLLNPEVCLP